MKIAMPVGKKDIATNVGTSFGRSPYFLVYDTETKESEFIENNAAMSSGGAGVKAAQTVIDSDAAVLLTPQCGENAANTLKSANIEIYKTTSKSIMESIDAYIAGELQTLDEIHDGFHDHGGH
ncbi:MAG: NifB/NifX family molybdenum-iron cluster-binding protein [Tissierellaceae bacterium]|nr:NifB/NifX family molybdenum-iron cluster-binding protein [Tissierellaceae bacterium]